MKRIYLLITLVVTTFYYGSAQRNEMVPAATRFIGTLSKEQQAKAVYPFDTDERFNFQFVPKDNRKGISFNEMETAQKDAAMALLKSCLGKEAFEKTSAIMQLEIVLKAIEQRAESDHYRDPGKYFITVFGIPGPKTTWGWRVEGHHVSFNFSAQNNRLVAATPTFLGSNPAIVPEGPEKGKQILKDETNMGFALLHSFSKEQVEKILIDTKAPGDILTFDKRTAMIEKPAGILWTEMNSLQQQQFLGLIKLYIHRFSKLFADDMLKEIQSAGFEKLRFAWAGAQQPGIGNPHYYRIHGPTIIIEYDNIQNNANHVHSVVRDLLHDFGGDQLLEHYKSGH
ncbi:MAG: DUF3500 domain-containing protein [Chitinophagaceae bacterium]